ncbi:MAG: MoaD/ThiS family protein [Cyclobacteriaceae bacterium]
MQIILFGIAKDIIGAQSLTLPGGHGVQTVHDLKNWLLDQYPAMGNLNSMAIAVDQEYAQDEMNLSENQEIALIPPISGG